LISNVLASLRCARTSLIVFRANSTMPQRRDVACWLEDGDTEDRFEEYGTVLNDDNTATTFIESNEGTTFNINVKFLGGIGSCSPTLLIDKQKINFLAIEKVEGNEGPRFRFTGIQKSETAFAPFVFGLNNITGIASLLS
jgi:hypothetical protein